MDRILYRNHSTDPSDSRSTSTDTGISARRVRTITSLSILKLSGIQTDRKKLFRDKWQTIF